MARIGRQRDRLASDTRVPSNKLPAIAIAASSSVVARPASSEAPYCAQSTTVAFHVMGVFLLSVAAPRTFRCALARPRHRGAGSRARSPPPGGGVGGFVCFAIGVGGGGAPALAGRAGGGGPPAPWAGGRDTGRADACG